jgi:GT2 family glycosyltransferase
MESSIGLREIGAVVLSFGREPLHAPLLDDLIHRQGMDPGSIVLVHNPFAPHDRWQPVAAAGVAVVRMPDNAGYAGGMNAGLRWLAERRAKTALLLTHDVRLDPGCVSELQRALGEDETVAVVGPVLRLPEQDGIWSTGMRETRGGARHQLSLGPDQFMPRDAVDGSVMLVRMSAVALVGGFDERFFMYWEETDLCRRCRTSGFRVGVSMSATAETQPGYSKRAAANSYLTTRNAMEYGRKSDGFAGAFWHGLAALDVLIRWTPKPWGPRGRNRRAWSIAGQRWLGGILGMRDFLLRRWGPPPRAVRRRSDMS